MGSDFTYSDIAGRKLTQDIHTLIKETTANYYVESVPKNKDDSIYSKIRYIVHKDYHVILKAMFYDLKSKKLKTLTNSKISVVNEVHVVMHSLMKNHQTNGETQLNVQFIKVGLPVKDDLLGIKGLKTQ